MRDAPVVSICVARGMEGLSSSYDCQPLILQKANMSTNTTATDSALVTSRSSAVWVPLVTVGGIVLFFALAPWYCRY